MHGAKRVLLAGVVGVATLPMLGGTALHAQRFEGSRAAVVFERSATPSLDSLRALGQTPHDAESAPLRPIDAALPLGGSFGLPGVRAPWYAPAASALLPGSGQALLRQQRSVAYLVAEGYLVVQALNSQRDANRERDAYRALARDVARVQTAGVRPVGTWPYYEAMQHVLESGEFNRTPASGFTPEANPATFNGSIWQLARETYWRNPDITPDAASPEYLRAIEFYRRRAVGEAFLWSWRDAQLEQDLFRQTIDRSNEASRRARQVVGLLLANHALSAVDAYVTVRLRVFASPDATTGVPNVGIAGSLPLRLGFR